MGERTLAAMLLAAGLVSTAGIAAGGWLIGKGMSRFRAEVRTVTVKGLVEQEVVADQATWRLSFRRASDSLADAHARISADRDAVTGFLKARGFEDREIESQPTRTVDKLAGDFGNPDKVRLRYVVSSAVAVKTVNVERVRASVGATEVLLKSGVILDGEHENQANPRYVFSQFNAMRPKLVAEATRNARAVAQQFADDSGALIGRIVSANQGNIQIFGSEGQDESAPYSPTSTPRKKIRVVSTFEFELR